MEAEDPAYDSAGEDRPAPSRGELVLRERPVELTVTRQQVLATVRRRAAELSRNPAVLIAASAMATTVGTRLLGSIVRQAARPPAITAARGERAVEVTRYIVHHVHVVHHVVHEVGRQALPPVLRD